MADASYADDDEKDALRSSLANSGSGAYSTDKLVSALLSSQDSGSASGPPAAYTPFSSVPPWAADQPAGPAPGAVGDQGGAQASAATQAPPPPPSPAPAAPVAPPAFNPAAIDALYQQGKISQEQYRQMGGTLPQAQGGQGSPAAAQARLATAQFATPPGSGAPASAPAPVQRPTVGGGGPASSAWVSTMDPTDRALLATGERNQLEGTDKEAAAEAAASDQIADIAKHGNEDLRVKQLLDQDTERKGREALEQHQDELQKRADDLAQQKIDPEHFWTSKSTGQRVGLGIALALGGFGASLGKTQNGAMDVVKGAIDNDLRAQEAALSSSKEGLKTATGILADKYRLFGDKNQAMAAARQEMLQGVSAQIDDVTREHQSPAILAKAEQLKGQLQTHFAAEGGQITRLVQQGGSGLTQAQLDKEAYELVKGKVYPTVEDAQEAVRRLHGLGATGATPGYYEKPTKPGGANPIDPATLPKELQSTNWEGIQRQFQGTDSAEHLRGQQRYKATVLSFAHGQGIRDNEKAEKAYGGYIVSPGDSQAVANEKLAAFKALVSKTPAGAAGDDEPEGFEAAK